MPEHVHLMLVPNLPRCPVPAILKELKEPFARAVISRWKSLGAPILTRLVDSRQQTRFWQRGGGYDRNIVSEKELFEKLSYIHTNPVTRGLVERPTDWKWSSARAYAGEADVLIKVEPII